MELSIYMNIRDFLFGFHLWILKVYKHCYLLLSCFVIHFLNYCFFKLVNIFKAPPPPFQVLENLKAPPQFLLNPPCTINERSLRSDKTRAANVLNYFKNDRSSKLIGEVIFKTGWENSAQFSYKFIWSWNLIGPKPNLIFQSNKSTVSHPLRP
jgi:hypothetical protein